MMARASSHEQAAIRLSGSDEEWAAVCWFYSAYHLVRCAMRQDSRFDDPSALAKIDQRLCMEDRDTTRHKGRGGGTRAEVGINDIVRLMYRDCRSAYHKLHQASIDVRYGEGLKAEMATLMALHEQVREGLPDPAS